MHDELDALPPRRPTCKGSLVCIGSREIALSETDVQRRHAYWCPAGCRGPESDGTFELVECPQCQSPDTSSTPRGDGVEEVECNACGTIASVQIVHTGG